MPPMLATHAGDPAKELLKKVGNISELELFHNAILVAIYMRPETTTLGGKPFFLPDSVAGKTGEDRFQGKVGLVISKGPLAFESDERTDFKGQNVEIGEWVCFRASDGWQLNLVRGPKIDDAVHCRLLVESDIRARIPSPDFIW